MHSYLIALGSNLGDRKYYIEEAISAIASQCGKVLARAEILESDPIGAADQVFFNTAMTLESSLEPEPLLEKLLQIEKDLGRVRSQRWGNRTIDLDLILWRTGLQTRIFQSPVLTLPHPETLVRAFVLGPAASIAPDWVHPLAGKTLGELWAEFPL